MHVGCANTQGTSVILSPDDNFDIGLFTHNTIKACYSIIPTNVEYTSKVSPTFMVKIFVNISTGRPINSVLHLTSAELSATSCSEEFNAGAAGALGSAHCNAILSQNFLFGFEVTKIQSYQPMFE